MSTENKKVFEAMDGNTATAHSAYPSLDCSTIIFGGLFRIRLA